MSTDADRAAFLGSARRLFLSESSERPGRDTRHYVEVPVREADDFSPGAESESGQSARLVNPLLFFSRLRKERTPTPYQSYAEAPWLSLIIGEYGWGKTELVFQLCDHMEESWETPLPVNLTLCRGEVSVLDGTPGVEEMARLLFGHIAKKAGVALDIVIDQIVPDIRNGSIVLLLDGLDELVKSQSEAAASSHHEAFFRGLLRLLSDGERESSFKVAVTMRLEYLSTVAPNVRDVQSFVASETSEPVNLYFVMLERLGDSHIKAYLDARAHDVPKLAEIFDDVKRFPRILEMLRRPLLLRIFCDIAGYPDFQPEKLLDDLQGDGALAKLFDRFTQCAVKDQQVRVAQDLLLKVVWEPDWLASKALELYRASRDTLKFDDLRDILAPAAQSTVDVGKLNSEMLLKGIHKCPFLQEQVSANDVAAKFAHKVFYEYFVARGMAEEIKKGIKGGTTEQRMFDELVLSVDMRKFLYGLLEEENVWREQTAYAYALRDPQEWLPPLDASRRDDLDKKRWTLLRSMTDPETLPDKTVETISWLLNEDTGWLHPRYLVYNYEAVAVYLWYQRGSREAPPIRKRLDEVLKAKIEELLAPAPSPERSMQRANALLIERILDIGRRRDFSWIAEFGRDRKAEVLGAISHPDDEDIRGRVAEVLKNIRGVEGPPPAENARDVVSL